MKISAVLAIAAILVGAAALLVALDDAPATPPAPAEQAWADANLILLLSTQVTE